MRRTILILMTLMIVGPASMAQTRKRSTAAKPKSTTTTATQRLSEARTAGATRVGEQIKFLSKFVYLFGGVTAGINAVDESIKKNEASPQIAAQNQQAKQMVKTNIIGFREALDKLEIDFRATPELQPYYIKLAGVASGAATAEQQAGSNQFDAAGRTLLNVVNRLTDVLLAMSRTGY